MKKIYSNSLILFFIALIAVPIYWSIGGQNSVQKYSDIEGRTLNLFPPLPRNKSRMALKSLLTFQFNQAKEQYFYQFLDRSFQLKVESASFDQFPLRLEGVFTAMAYDREMIALAYAPLPDIAIPTDMKSNLYITRDHKYIIYGPDDYSNLVRQEIDKRVKNYNTLISLFPNQNFYLFYQQRLANSPYNPLNKYFPNSDQGQALDYFKSKKPVDLQMAEMLLSSFEEHKIEYFSTDHHWNVNGIGIAYNKAYDLLSTNYKDISPRLNLDNVVTFQGVKFLGSLARESFFPIQPDEFKVFKLDLPPYEVLLNGKIIKYNHSDDYWNGEFPEGQYMDHYGMYYGSQRDILEFSFSNSSTRNLIIIGSSFVRPIVPMLASHYHHTYYIDKRQTSDFSLSKFMQDHPVDDVLFFGDNTVAFTNSLWAVEP